MKRVFTQKNCEYKAKKLARETTSGYRPTYVDLISVSHKYFNAKHVIVKLRLIHPFMNCFFCRMKLVKTYGDEFYLPSGKTHNFKLHPIFSV